MKYLTISIILMFFPVSSIAYNTLRCGKHLVTTGDTKAEVIKVCGKPDDWKGNQWTYRQKKGRFIKFLIFNGNVLAKVKNGPRER